ncbi:MAG TPA: ATPase, T2SS/T4P/T4SS family, partial [Armatimonadota bacterium]|nr:ATPase, T2SS/T4P/T4SS family [Armatimonadota bacterium]
HLVLSTLHTNDAPGAVTRLVDMGIEPFLVASTLVGAVAQRLVRVLCDNCKEPWVFDAGEYPRLGDAAALLEGKTVYRPRGCDQCRFSGYRGRTAVFEILTMSEPVERLILRRASTGEIREQSISQGMRTLRQDGISRVIAGVTSVEEIIRVTQEEMENQKPIVVEGVA